jgi:hypothetical protein
MGRDEVGRAGYRRAERPNISVLVRIARYKNGPLFPNFKTGALNHSATLPLLRHQSLGGGKIKNSVAIHAK